jgi:hypothetical protein
MPEPPPGLITHERSNPNPLGGWSPPPMNLTPPALLTVFSPIRPSSKAPTPHPPAPSPCRPGRPLPPRQPF